MENHLNQPKAPEKRDVLDMDKLIDELWLKDSKIKEAIIKDKLTNRQLALDDLESLYNKASDYGTGLVIAKNLLDIQSLPSNKKTIAENFFKHLALEKFESDAYTTKISETEDLEKRQPQEWKIIAEKHGVRPPFEDFYEIVEDLYYGDFSEMKAVAMKKMAKSEALTEDFCLEALKNDVFDYGMNWSSYLPEGIREHKNEIDYLWFGEGKDLALGKSGELTSEKEKEQLNEKYPFYKICLDNLIKTGTKKSIDFVANFLIFQNYGFGYFYEELSEILRKDKKYSAEQIIKTIFDKDFSKEFSPEHIQQMMLFLIDLISAEEIRMKLNNALAKLSENEDRYALRNLKFARILITPNHDKIAIENLQKFYQEKIKFEDYKVNQEMNAGEVKLLQELIGKDEKVLEEGCGTGRLMLEMKKAGYDITGFDFTARHTEIIKEQDAEAKVLQGDWHQTGFKDESFGTVYSLGRNILHDYSIVDQVQLFREAARILRPGGKFIFDIPDREKGGYKKMVEEYGREMENRGIKNYRRGAIYDSPDGVNFATRYAYAEEDIKMLAQVAGFKIVEMRRAELATGEGDENLYFVLEKIKN
jgi:SAM-dependent methyltransferase